MAHEIDSTAVIDAAPIPQVWKRQKRQVIDVSSPVSMLATVARGIHKHANVGFLTAAPIYGEHKQVNDPVACERRTSAFKYNFSTVVQEELEPSHRPGRTVNAQYFFQTTVNGCACAIIVMHALSVFKAEDKMGS